MIVSFKSNPSLIIQILPLAEKLNVHGRAVKVGIETVAISEPFLAAKLTRTGVLNGQRRGILATRELELRILIVWGCCNRNWC